jgi:hypothetical protein
MTPTERQMLLNVIGSLESVTACLRQLVDRDLIRAATAPTKKRKPTKTARIVARLLTERGATRPELRMITGNNWRMDMNRIAERHGLDIRRERDGRVTRYFATRIRLADSSSP